MAFALVGGSIRAAGNTTTGCQAIDNTKAGEVIKAMDLGDIETVLKLVRHNPGLLDQACHLAADRGKSELTLALSGIKNELTRNRKQTKAQEKYHESRLKAARITATCATLLFAGFALMVNNIVVSLQRC